MAMTRIYRRAPPKTLLPAPALAWVDSGLGSPALGMRAAAPRAAPRDELPRARTAAPSEFDYCDETQRHVRARRRAPLCVRMPL